jgi:serine/threonine-protein kinase HipA
MSELLILIEGGVAGRIASDRAGRLSLAYERDWLNSSSGYPLSVSLPLAALTYPHKTVWPFLWNLLPENPSVLQRWGRQYHVSPANPFKLLTYVGADVPGAAQLISPERLAEVQAEQVPLIEWMSLDDLASRLNQLRDDMAAMRRPEDIGKMSLPGMQAKTAYYWDEARNRWGVPGGRTPTTHIVKPCIPGFDGLVENEHLCQDIAARIQLPAARTFVLPLDQPYIVVERYDRLPPVAGSSFVRRIHQEDICQSLGLMPGAKYEEDGGPGIAAIVKLLRRVSAAPEEDVTRFVRANIFNWLMGGTDAHAKNYSLLISHGNEVRLAPLYDLSSQLPYPELVAQRLAMRIGVHYQFDRIVAADWQQMARVCGLDPEAVMRMIRDMAQVLPDAIEDARAQAIEAGLSQKVVSPLARRLIEHARQRMASLKPGIAPARRPLRRRR